MIISNYVWGPISYGPGPLAHGEYKGPSRRRLWPKLKNIKHKMARRCSRGQFSPRQTQSFIDKSGIGTNFKDQKISQKKLPLIPFPDKTLHLTKPDFWALSTTPNDSGIRLTGQISVLEKLTLHVDEGQRT